MTDMMVHAIEDNIPCPPTDRGRGNARHPFKDMKVGQSILITGPRARSGGEAAYRAGKVHNMKFTVRTVMVEGGRALRVWRTA